MNDGHGYDGVGVSVYVFVFREWFPFFFFHSEIWTRFIFTDVFCFIFVGVFYLNVLYWPRLSLTNIWFLYRKKNKHHTTICAIGVVLRGVASKLYKFNPKNNDIISR